MTEWEVVGVIVVLVGLVISVAGPMVKLNSTITKLTVQVAHLTQGLDEFKGQYKDQLNEFKGVHEDINKRVDDHEHRITVLEERREDR